MTIERARGWYALERPTNAAAYGVSRAVVRIYDAIGGWFGADPLMFAEELDALDVDEIELRVNSPGGDVFDGLAIMNTLQAHPARVIAYVDGLAASAASYIVVGGADEVVMCLGAEMMLHNPRAITIGNAELHRDSADRLDKIADSLITVYQRKAGGEQAAWRQVLAAETWYSAQEAVDAGLADRVDRDAQPEPVSNRFGIQFSAYAGRAQAPTPAMPGRQTPAAAADGTLTEERNGMSPTFLDEIRTRLGTADNADEPTLLTALDQALAALEALNEQSNEPAAGAPQLPDGVVTIEKATLDELRASARRGDDARAQQELEGRERAVDAAIQDGRIPPARRDGWLAALAADPAAVETLNALEKGLVPVSAIGRDDADDYLGQDVYEQLFGKENA